MKYELAKYLKEAGFPQRRGCSACLAGTFLEDQETARPTLEELIEACGEEFATLQFYGAKKHWAAFAFKEYRTENNNRRTNELREVGITPTEAVARLWLALNKKI